MKPNSTASDLLRPSLCCLVLASSLLASAANAAEYVGRLVQITETKVIVENLGEFKIDRKTAQCFDHRGDKTTCATLAAIGYADKAKVTVIDDTVQRIDVLKMSQ